MQGLIEYNHIPVGQSTFKAGQTARVHKWFRLTPSFGPDLVRHMLTQLECKQGEFVLDPFSGASTTLIECKLAGQSAYGFEINPFLHWVGQTSLEWNIEPETLRSTLSEIEKKYKDDIKFITFSNLEQCNLTIPKIHNPLRWWREDVITELLVLKQCIANCSTTKIIKDFFLLALAGTLIPDLTNVTLGRLQLHFIDRTNDVINVIETFIRHAKTMIADLEKLHDYKHIGTHKVFNIDALMPSNELVHHPISCVITSPPYPNRYSYVWNTRPYLYFFDYFNNAKQASELDLHTIGGTWGTATSILNKGVLPPAFDFLQDIISPTIELIRAQDNLMANYVMKYFNLLSKQIWAMEKLPQKRLRCAYVVGVSRVKNIYVETDVLLAKIFNKLGYASCHIERIRKRNSGKDLHESIVYAYKN